VTAPDPAVQEALRSAAVRYTLGLDTRDVALFLSAFTPDATLAVRAEPGAQVRPSVRKGHQDLAVLPEGLRRFAKTHHMLGQHHYSTDGSRVRGEVYCTARHLRIADGGRTDVVMIIRYLDEYAPADDGVTWLIRSREVVVEWTETTRAD
jgi:hypothetical protein